MGPQDDDVYEFGPFRLDASEKLLSRNGTTLPLEPTQLQVLTTLVRGAGHLVSRADLTRTVWKDTYVDEGSLTVTISMLRRKLGDTPSKPRYIETVRKSGYRFVGPVTRHSRGTGGGEIAAPSVSKPPRVIPLRWYGDPIGAVVSIAVMAALIAVMTGWYWSHSEVIRESTLAPLPVHPFGGIQDNPSFSPDGSQVAFTWRPPESANDDIYVLKIGDLHATRLTTDPASEKSPVWSPDGRQIAFIRRKGSNGEILLISPAGGAEQRVIDTSGTSVTWSADSQTLASIDRAAGEDAYSIFLVPAAGGPKRQVTFPAVETTYGDSSPAISPDGRTLAFVRHVTYDVADIFVQPLDTMKASRLTFDKRQIRGLAWMSNGKELIFSSNRNGRHQLWRVNTSETAQPTVVAGIIDARSPAVSRSRTGSPARLVYQAFTEDYNIRLLTRGVGGAWNASRAPFAASIRDEQSPRVSPDGRRLAFVSDRSGWFEVWTCAYPEGSDCRQLTSFQQGYLGAPAWSPDSQRIAFDVRVDGNADIHLVRADGGQPVRLTHETSVESRPNWSSDGRWIYFRSDRTGTHQIWKLPIAGGAAVQVTRNGGFDAFESPDGKSVYYVRERYRWGLWSVPVDGGPETRVPKTGTVTASSWTVIDNGILWIDVTASNPPATIRFHDLATHEVSDIAQVTASVISSATGFSAVRDGSVLMWSQLDRSAADLMLLERFR